MPHSEGEGMAAINNITFFGKSGKRYDFHAYPLNEELQHVEAVYALTHCDQNRLKKYSHRIIYIGETGDLSTCLDDHAQSACFREHGVNCICVYTEKSQDERLMITADLAENYRSPCNDFIL